MVTGATQLAQVNESARTGVEPVTTNLGTIKLNVATSSKPFISMFVVCYGPIIL